MPALCVAAKSQHDRSCAPPVFILVTHQAIYLKLAIANFNAVSNLPIVLAGDMNSTPDTRG